MASDDELLEAAARDGSLDIAEWPRLLESVLQKLHDVSCISKHGQLYSIRSPSISQIVHSGFPLPTIPPPQRPTALEDDAVTSTPVVALHTETTNRLDREASNAPLDDELPPNSQNSTKENEAPLLQEDGPERSSGFESHEVRPLFRRPDLIEGDTTETLPSELRDIYASSVRILKEDFGHSPPYTIQRLAELVLYPKRYYRFLPSYLRALDRIVSVSSPLFDFPLPALNPSLSANGFLTNGEVPMNGATEREGLGSDESLGGALLTPIPWLRQNNGDGSSQSGELRSESTETIDGPNGCGSVETVSVTVNGISSTTGISHNSPTPASPTLSDQSDASSSTSSGSTEAQLRQQGGVTQGELLRQEQEAGVVPVSQGVARRTVVLGSMSAAVGRDAPAIDARRSEQADGPEDDIPHARGPEVIGMEDTGPQHGNVGGAAVFDIEAAAGQAKSPPSQTSPQAGYDGAVDALTGTARPDDDTGGDVEMSNESNDGHSASADGAVAS